MGLIKRREGPAAPSTRLKVAIAGFGAEGRAIWEYLKTQGPGMDITVLDETEVAVPAGAASRLGPEVFDSTLDYDIVWRASPAIAPSRLKTKGEIKTMTQEFFERCPAKIIGVTGSKGKGTTATLAAAILEAAGQKTHLIGNIGVPALSVLDKIKPADVVVFELSSFQLWDLKTSPKVAVILMIEPDHLDVHADLADYLGAKSNIARWQGPDDTTIYLGDNRLSAQAASVGLGRKIRLFTPEAADIRGGKLLIDGQEICPVADFGLPGPHNQVNVAAALTAAWQFKQDAEAAAKAIKSFGGLPHRLQVVAVKDGVKFVDDSISTTPGSAIAAVDAFLEPKVLILGGSDKGADFSGLAAKLSRSDSVVKALLIGQTAGRIRQALDKTGFQRYESIAGGMDAVVKRAGELCPSGGVVLLSPACASFDMFKDYQDRAARFQRAVGKL